MTSKKKIFIAFPVRADAKIFPQSLNIFGFSIFLNSGLFVFIKIYVAKYISLKLEGQWRNFALITKNKKRVYLYKNFLSDQNRRMAIAHFRGSQAVPV